MRPVHEPDLMTVASPCPTSTKTTVVPPEAPPEVPVAAAPEAPVPPETLEPVGAAVGVGRGVLGFFVGDAWALPAAPTPPACRSPEA